MHATFLYNLSEFLINWYQLQRKKKRFHLRQSQNEKQGCQEGFQDAAMLGCG